MLPILNEECEKLNYLPRKIQTDTVNWLESIWGNNTKCKIISSPVGSGKSLVAKTIAEYNSKLKLKTAIITPQNLLIDQYINEFPNLNYFKGKAHYKCDKTQDTCEIGIELEKSTKVPCNDCPYRSAKNRCYEENISVYNPISYINLPKILNTDIGSECIYDIDTIIIDEVQSLPNMLRDLTSVKLWTHDIKWKKGTSSSIQAVIELLNQYSDKLGTFIYSNKIDKKDKIKFLSAQRKIDYVVYQLIRDSSYFICEETEEKYKGSLTDCLLVRPKYVTPAVYNNFFKFSKKIILMSGTIFQYVWEELGFKDPDYIDLPSPIPKERRKIYATNTININSKLNHLERWDMLQFLASQIKYIVDILHPNDNGVILLSYGLAEELKSLLSDEHYHHMDKRTKKDKIEEFKDSTARKVGIFSGAYEGLSLDDEISRFTIIPKVTYPNLTDNIVKIRCKEKPLNYSLETMSTMIQASGRSSRSENDYSAIYILDSNFIKLYSITRQYLPKYFKESLNFNLPTEEDINNFNNFRGQPT